MRPNHENICGTCRKKQSYCPCPPPPPATEDKNICGTCGKKQSYCTCPPPPATEDKGKHYRKHYRYSFKGVNMDLYRVAKIYGIDGGPREHMLKKILRGGGKGHSELELINELQCCLDRWKQMQEEDAN